MVQVSRDCFGRSDIVREVVKTKHGLPMVWRPEGQGRIVPIFGLARLRAGGEDSRRVLRDRLHEVLSQLNRRGRAAALPFHFQEVERMRKKVAWFPRSEVVVFLLGWAALVMVWLSGRV